ncbi:MAG: PilN domain-containing protein [Pseudomonadota bacterium]
MSDFQQVNLMSAELVPQRELLSEQQVLIGWCGFVVLLLLISGFDGWRGSALQDQIAETQQQISQLDQAVEQLETSLAGGKARLRADILNLEEQRRAQSALASALVTEQEQKGLSRALVSLAESKVQGLWLSEISVHRNGLNLRGRATDAVLLPEFIQELSARARFAGYSFQAVNMELDEERGGLSFELRAPEGSGVVQ